MVLLGTSVWPIGIMYVIGFPSPFQFPLLNPASFISIPDGGVIVSDSFAPAPVSETVKLSSFEPDEPLQLERPEIVPLVEIFGPVVIVSPRAET